MGMINICRVEGFRTPFDLSGAELGNAVRWQLERLQHDAGVSLSGKNILIKPNVMGSMSRRGRTTSPECIAETVLRLRESGVSRILVGESSFEGWERHLRQQIEKVPAAPGRDLFEISDLNRDRNRGMMIENTGGSSSFSHFMIPDAFNEADIFINMPAIKTHFAAVVSLSIKNNMGLLSDAYKKAFHLKGFVECIADFNASLKDYLEKNGKFLFVLADGLSGMEGNGPYIGTSKPLGVLMSGTSQTETDIFISEKVIGVEYMKVPHLAQAAKLSGIVSADAIEQFPGSDFGFRPFILPDTFGSPVLWPDGVFVSDKACCGCSGSIFNLLKSPKAASILGTGYDIYAGPFETAAEKEGPKIAFGRCAVASFIRNGFAEGPDMIFVSGCPPQFDEVMKKLAQK